MTYPSGGVASYLEPQANDKRTSPSLSTLLKDLGDGIEQVQQYVYDTLYAPATHVGYYLVQDGSGHASWAALPSFIAASSGTATAVDGANEGGQINFAGAGAYDTWQVDVYQASFRFAKNSVVKLTVTDGQLELANKSDNSGSILKLNNQTQSVTVSLNASHQLVTAHNGTDVRRSSAAGLDEVKNGASWYPVSHGTKLTTYSTSAPSGGADGDVWMKYT